LLKRATVCLLVVVLYRVPGSVVTEEFKGGERLIRPAAPGNSERSPSTSGEQLRDGPAEADAAARPRVALSVVTEGGLTFGQLGSGPGVQLTTPVQGPSHVPAVAQRSDRLVVGAVGGEGARPVRAAGRSQQRPRLRGLARAFAHQGSPGGVEPDGVEAGRDGSAGDERRHQLGLSRGEAGPLGRTT
jgi:hypothetical protein